jgi:hypothetical protein
LKRHGSTPKYHGSGTLLFGFEKTDLEGEMEEDEEGQGDEAEEAAHHLQHRPQPIRIQYLFFTTAQPISIQYLLSH